MRTMTRAVWVSGWLCAAGGLSMQALADGAADPAASATPGSSVPNAVSDRAAAAATANSSVAHADDTEDPSARLDALLKRGRLSAHTAGVVQQARGVAQRLREASNQHHANDVSRLDHLLRALVNLAEATQARDDERALYAASARRRSDVEAQLKAAANAAETRAVSGR